MTGPGRAVETAHDIADANLQLRAAHHDETSTLQKAVDRVTASVGWPGFAAVAAAAMSGWVGINLWLVHAGVAPLDPPPFADLQSALAVGGFLMVALVLTTQRREDQLAGHRAQMILELSVLTDQKISKVIELLEESRRDNPSLRDRADGEAAAMSTPADTRAVLEAIKDVQPESA